LEVWKKQVKFMKLSEYYGKKIYDTRGKLRGAIHEVVLDMESGTISSIALDRITNLAKVGTKTEAKKKLISYGKVRSADEIVLVDMEE